MKIYRSILFVVLPAMLLYCSQTTAPINGLKLSDDLQIELLKRIYLLDVTENGTLEQLNYYKRTGTDLVTWSTEEEFLQKLKGEINHLEFSRPAVLLLAGSQVAEADQFLLDVLKNASDQFLRFNAARALAYRGKNDGLELLRQCAVGDLVLTNSGLEQHAAALALLLLNEKLPTAYLQSGFADPLYVKLSK